jgi:hypothetical protein
MRIEENDNLAAIIAKLVEEVNTSTAKINELEKRVKALENAPGQTPLLVRQIMQQTARRIE